MTRANHDVVDADVVRGLVYIGLYRQSQDLIAVNA